MNRESISEFENILSRKKKLRREMINFIRDNIELVSDSFVKRQFERKYVSDIKDDRLLVSAKQVQRRLDEKNVV